MAPSLLLLFPLLYLLYHQLLHHYLLILQLFIYFTFSFYLLIHPLTLNNKLFREYVNGLSLFFFAMSCYIYLTSTSISLSLPILFCILLSKDLLRVTKKRSILWLSYRYFALSAAYCLLSFINLSITFPLYL